MNFAGRLKRFLVAPTVAVLLVPGLATAADRKMSDTDSYALAKALSDAVSEGGKASGYAFNGEPSDPKSPHLEFFENWSTPGGQGVMYFALDLYTGDGWDMTTCEEIKSRKLAQLQRQIRRRIGLTERRYRQIKITLQPCN